MIDWQTVISICIVIAAALWLLRGMVATVRKGLGNNPADSVGCGNCPKNPATKAENNLVQLSRPKRDSR
ncbi:hypothetical protein [Novipirellula maiorica]|uniref:hypothetical protein n=1 Tax=Novipirellula maiorica TaxID=1265734 RepID=UPI001181AEDB|nr:hypothetical protein [Rhodopirellula maiorica]